MAYVKYSGVSDSVAQIVSAIEEEPDLDKRADLYNNLITSVSTQITGPIARLCYQKKTLGEPSDITAIKLGISQRAVLRCIRRWASDNGLKSPLDRIQVDSVIDIRDYVRL